MALKGVVGTKIWPGKGKCLVSESAWSLVPPRQKKIDGFGCGEGWPGNLGDVLGVYVAAFQRLLQMLTVNSSLQLSLAFCPPSLCQENI